MTEPIKYFRGRYRFLSNFYPEPAGYTVEHYYQAAKTLDIGWYWRILDAKSPGEAKRLGRQAPIREDWEAIKESVMLDELRIKFSNPELRAMLLATGDAELIEGNNWGDTYWGVDDTLGGQNRLGQLLMQVRHEYAER